MQRSKFVASGPSAEFQGKSQQNDLHEYTPRCWLNWLSFIFSKKKVIKLEKRSNWQKGKYIFLFWVDDVLGML